MMVTWVGRPSKPNDVQDECYIFLLHLSASYNSIQDCFLFAAVKFRSRSLAGTRSSIVPHAAIGG